MKPDELAKQPSIPEELGHLWRWFLELQNLHPDRITYAEIDHWSRLTHKNVTAMEVEVLRKLDALYWQATNG